MREIESFVERPVADHDRRDEAPDWSVGAGERRALASTKHREPQSGPRVAPEQIEVMIVDDDAVVLQLVKRIFESFGYRVATASGSAEAMADLSLKQFDLVVTDLEMPGIDGFRLGTWIKAAWPATRVVIMTGRCRTGIPRSMRDGAMDGWIFKPFSLADMCDTLERLSLPHPPYCGP
jgi:two-component system capsular synthesis sensor histidine kinase RcsC